MAKPKAYVISGLGIGCHEEVAHAYTKAGADAEIIHIKQILNGQKKLSETDILNLAGGFLHGDMLGSGMCAANEIEHSIIPDGDEQKRLKEVMIKFAEKGNVIWGQCNGFQLLVKTGLLPGIDNDYSKQTLTLTHNDCGNYRVAPVLHKIEMPNHFAFKGIDDTDLYLWCRHGEGKIQFHSEYGLIKKEEGEQNRKRVNESHVLLRYADPATKQATEEFPHNPNGSVDGIAGLTNPNGNIFGQMAHPEVGIYKSRDPRFFQLKDEWRRQGIKAADIDEKRLEDTCLQIFKNIIEYVK
jgi:phosphoribosylformylglycinamidine synthase subunit PurQ / glutaminase